MKLLIVAATLLEIKPLLVKTGAVSVTGETHYRSESGKTVIDFLITGVGMVATAYGLTKHLAKNQYDLAINAGIAGTFDPGIPLGSVLNIVSDSMPEFGVEHGEGYISVFDLGFLHPDHTPYTGGILQSRNPWPENLSFIFGLEKLPKVHGMTSNIIRGSAESAEKIRNLSGATTESMEGAAFFYVCILEGLPCLQIRSVSNLVGERSKSKWDIPLAVENLNNELLRIFIEKNQ